MNKFDFKEVFKSGFENFENSLNGQGKSALHAIRRDAFSEFMSLNIPTTRDEEWKYTNISPITGREFVPAPVNTSKITDEQLSRFFLVKDEYINLIFVNGTFRRDLSDTAGAESGLTISTIREAFDRDAREVSGYYNRTAELKGNIFAALNSSFVTDGLYIRAAKNTTAGKAVRILHLISEADNTVISPRNLFIAEQGSSVDIIESVCSLDDSVSFINTVTEAYTAPDAFLSHYIVQELNLNSYFINTMESTQQSSSNYTSLNLGFGGAIARSNISTRFTGENATATLNGLFLAEGTQLIDNHTLIDHAVPRCQSHELYKGVLGGKARGVFNGKVMVRQDAQKTNAFQENKTILLSDDAIIDTKPQLEIFADDVKCTHGATVGQLDDESLFYLKSRGIGEDLAKTMLINAFADDVIMDLKYQDLRDYLEVVISKRLG